MSDTGRGKEKILIAELRRRAAWVRRETLRLHKRAPETRIASSLSDVELFTALYYGGLLKFNPSDPRDESRDRVIVSKGHGGISLYPILADLGFFDKAELGRIGKTGSILGGIPDDIPGFETINGSLGHGLGVGCGMALALKRKGSPANVVALAGDGELFEGSVWEAVMFAGHHRLDNLVLIVDRNKISMLGLTSEILDLDPLAVKFKAFGWAARVADGHDVGGVRRELGAMIPARGGRPKVFIAETIKGKGALSLEKDTLCHIRTLTPEQVDALTEEYK
ncbi:MAG: transketolase [Elusimicrobia bacterium GWC2_56_31]|nr:MAG: transketolase [Elusimicrobia bacterium GWC2_56_31]HBB67672.1 transketolase [Elusimicrobiota bacterium]HBW22854.1 transketolase [Elusimicrobiota bacterium]